MSTSWSYMPSVNKVLACITGMFYFGMSLRILVKQHQESTGLRVFSWDLIK